MQEATSLSQQSSTVRDKLIQYLKKYEGNNLQVSSKLLELSASIAEKQRDLQLLEACVYARDTKLFSVLIKQVFLFRHADIGSALQNIIVRLEASSDKNPKEVIKICFDKLSANDLTKLKEAFRNLSLIETDFSKRGSLLLFLNSYIKTEMTFEKLIKLLSALVNSPDRENMMTNILAGIDNTYKSQSEITANTSNKLLK